MQQRPLSRQSILCPETVDMDQRALPGAKQVVLKRRDRDEILT